MTLLERAAIPGRAVAGKLTALVFSSTFDLAYQLSSGVESLYRASGDSRNALLWRRRWTRGLLAPVSIWDTRQIEFAKEISTVPADYPRYGNTVAGPPGDTTWLRIVARTRFVNEHTYTAYTSLDGVTWYRNGTWTHDLGGDVKIGLVAMGRRMDPTDYTAYFQHLRVDELKKP